MSMETNSLSCSFTTRAVIWVETAEFDRLKKARQALLKKLFAHTDGVRGILARTVA
ncbi:MAG: hypothetical protein ACYDBP_00205 [Leptospirales bacterium]